MTLRRWHHGALVGVLLCACSADRSETRRTSFGPADGSGVIGATVPQPGPGAMMGGGAPIPSATLPPLAAPGPAGAAGGGAAGCPMGRANAAPVTPTVWLVIDGSTSMNDDLGGTTRWNALRSALMDPDGLVAQLQSAVHFGMVLYSGQFPVECDPSEHVNRACGCFRGFEDACCTEACGYMPPTMDYCMGQLALVPPAVNNHAAISMAYPPEPVGGWTPTDRALAHVVSQLPPGGATDPKHPIYTLLATDGAPNDWCLDDGGGAFGRPQPAVLQRVIDNVTAGVMQGMQMFVISLAGDDAELRAHLEQAAQIGKPGQTPYEPANKQQLIDALRQIVGGATCQVSLDGTVTAGRECEGTVQLNGMPLPCGSPDGWQLLDPRTVQINGAACAAFLGAPSEVTADFPCNVFAPD